jgi:hypothetical protein
MTDVKTFHVLREHHGDKEYRRGDTREISPSDAAQLVSLGVLALEAPSKAQRGAPANKAESGAPSNKGEATAGEIFIRRKGDEVIAAIADADKDLLAAALEAELAKGEKQRKGVVDALTAALAA